MRRVVRARSRQPGSPGHRPTPPVRCCACPAAADDHIARTGARHQVRVICRAASVRIATPPTVVNSKNPLSPRIKSASTPVSMTSAHEPAQSDVALRHPRGCRRYRPASDPRLEAAVHPGRCPVDLTVVADHQVRAAPAVTVSMPTPARIRLSPAPAVIVSSPPVG